MPELKLGKKPAAPRPTDFKFTEFAASIQLPPVPSRFGHGSAYADWKMLGNDHYGNCVWAGAAHEHMLLNKIVHQADVSFDDSAVLGDYAAATGFDPNDPSTDNGTDVHDALSYRRLTGIADTTGTRHFIGAYVSLDPKNWEHLAQATYIFGAVGIGFEFPASAMDQFNAGELWDYVAGSKIEGGHYVRSSAHSTPPTRRRRLPGASVRYSRATSTSTTTTRPGRTSHPKNCAATEPACTASTWRSSTPTSPHYVGIPLVRKLRRWSEGRDVLR